MEQQTLYQALAAASLEALAELCYSLDRAAVPMGGPVGLAFLVGVRALATEEVARRELTLVGREPGSRPTLADWLERLASGNLARVNPSARARILQVEAAREFVRAFEAGRKRFELEEPDAGEVRGARFAEAAAVLRAALAEFEAVATGPVAGN